MANDPFATQASSETAPTDQAGYAPAGFWIRFVAMFIDGVIVGVVGFLFQLPLLFVQTSGAFSDSANVVAQIVNMVIGLIIGLIYVRSYTTKGATPGKRIFGIKVLNAQTGMHMTYGKTLLREYLGKIIINWLTLGIGFLMAAFRSDKRGLHDFVAGTIVVRKIK